MHCSLSLSVVSDFGHRMFSRALVHTLLVYACYCSLRRKSFSEIAEIYSQLDAFRISWLLQLPCHKQHNDTGNLVVLNRDAAYVKQSFFFLKSIELVA